MTTNARRSLRVSVAIATLAAAVSPGAATATSSERHSEPLGVGDERVVPGEYLVGLDLPEGASTLAGLDIEHLGFGIYRITDDGSIADPAQRAAELSQLLGATVEPNRVSRLMVDNTEPDAMSQWHLENTGQFAGGVVDADIDGEEAWGAASGTGIVVAVIDSGADMDHPDLAANLWVNTGETPGNGIDDDGNGFIDDVNGYDFYGVPIGLDEYLDDNDPEDTSGSGHGTAVAGIIASPINGVGTAGIAHESRIMVLRACGLLECPDSTVIQAIYYAANNGADVINLSLGRSAGGHVSFELAVQTAIDGGAVVVAAAGNGGADGIGDDNDAEPLIPASFDIDGLLAVAMTDHADDISPASNYGATSVHLGAPGVSIWTLNLSGGHGWWSGTSFATPATAGTAALVREHRSCYTPAQVASVIETSGDPAPALAGITTSGKRLNAFSALDVAAKKNDIVITVDPGAVTFKGGAGATTWTFGDGDSVMGEAAQHVYDIGVYTADDGTDTYDIAVGIDFADTCTNKFINEIIWLSGFGITLGCDTTPNFCPDETVIRSHMASFLARALDLPPASGDYFTDDDGLSHEENINRLFESGVTLGCNDGPDLFCPDDEVTREQMATFLVRALGLPATSTDYFDDDSGTHQPNINALAESGITLGCEANMFCPKEGIERDEMAAFLFRGRMYLP